MRLFNKKTAIAIFSIFTLLPVSAFEAQDILSPVSGRWNNVQPLVLNNPLNEELYYSLSGTDPLVSGFAYDGPVVIDETGSISVNITAVEKSGRRRDFKVEYYVEPGFKVTASEDTIMFLQGICQNPIVRYVSGTELKLPQGFKYSLSNNESPYLETRTLTLHEQNLFDLYQPVIIAKDGNSFHFLVHVVKNPEKSYAASFKKEHSLPFELEGWDTVVFTDRTKIWQLDDGLWTGESEPLKIDRSISHSISWQDLAYEEGNPVESYIIPSKPELVKKTGEKGQIIYSIPENYKFQISMKGINELYNSMCFDSFYGTEISRDLELEVYYDGVRTGIFCETISVDRNPPSPPVISSTADSVFTRSETELLIEHENDTKVFFAMSSPVLFESVQELKDFDFASNVKMPDYIPYEGQNLILKSVNDRVTWYKVNAFAEDHAGNVSTVSEYEVVVDQYNYYLNEKSAETVSDGTWAHPFKSLKEAASVINKNNFTKLHVMGTVHVNEGTVKLNRDCLISGVEGHIVFDGNSSLEINGASVKIENFIVEKTSSSGQNQRMFVLNGGNLSAQGCEIIGIFSSDGILIDARQSEITFTDSGLTVQGADYACAVSALNSKLYLSQSRFTSIAQTSVNFSLHSGSVDLISSYCTIISQLGRCMELSDVKASLKDNKFTASLSGNRKNAKPVWKDADTQILVNENNTQEGF